MIRKWVALGLLLVAVAGVVLIVVGFTRSRFTVETTHFTVDYDRSTQTYYNSVTGDQIHQPEDLVEKDDASYNADVAFAEKEWPEVPKIADRMRSTPIWIGVLIVLIFGCTGIGILRSVKYY